jgi:hypothetical protein
MSKPKEAVNNQPCFPKFSSEMPAGHQIATKLERAGVVSTRTASIKAFAPVGRAERSTLYGESLPPGLLLDSGEDAEQ